LPAVRAPDGLVIPAPARLVKLAADASARTALSSRGELYPRGMAPAQAIALAFGALARQRTLTVEQIREPVLSETRAVLYTDAGLIGRYRLQGLLADIRDALSRPGGLPGSGCWSP